jgi:hypothetical protein
VPPQWLPTKSLAVVSSQSLLQGMVFQSAAGVFPGDEPIVHAHRVREKVPDLMQSGRRSMMPRVSCSSPLGNGMPSSRTSSVPRLRPCGPPPLSRSYAAMKACSHRVRAGGGELQRGACDRRRRRRAGVGRGARGGARFLRADDAGEAGPTRVREGLCNVPHRSRARKTFTSPTRVNRGPLVKSM